MTSKIIMVPGMLSFMGGKLMTHGGMCQIVPNLVSTNATIQYTTTENDYQITKVTHVGPTVAYDDRSVGSLHIDPIYDYLGWYGFDDAQRWANMVPISIGQLNDLMITMRELNRELEMKLQDIVLVQSMGYDRWNVFCYSAEDTQTIIAILARKPVSIALTVFPKDLVWLDLIDEITEWCKVTLTDKYTINQSHHKLNGKFKNDSDAALFKLKWTYA